MKICFNSLKSLLHGGRTGKGNWRVLLATALDSFVWESLLVACLMARVAPARF